MPRNVETNPNARDALLGYLESGQTGCLTGRTAGGPVAVYVMLGEVLAAHADDDDARVLALLANAGTVELARLEQLRERIAEGTPISEALFDAVPDQEVLDLFFERFRENLFQFLAGSVQVEFTPMEAVFTDNIQVGHDSRALIAELDALQAQLRPVLMEPDAVLVPGTASPVDPEQARLLRFCGDGAPLGHLVQRAPWEASRTLERILAMLDAGVLALRTAGLGEEDDAFLDDPPTEESGPRWDGGGELDAELAAFQDYDSSRSGGDFVTERALLDRVDLDGAPAPARPSLPVSSETVIEMEEADQAAKETAGAVSLNFSGPRLQDDEAWRKIEVVNEVLATICAALEEVEGHGAGQAHLQVLVEATAGPSGALFKNVEVEADGRLPAEAILKNLRKRPATEQRRLLTRGLSDLVERALSLAYEGLEEARLEAMLEHIAGYQQRLGI